MICRDCRTAAKVDLYVGKLAIAARKISLLESDLMESRRRLKLAELERVEMQMAAIERTRILTEVLNWDRFTFPKLVELCRAAKEDKSPTIELLEALNAGQNQDIPGQIKLL